MTRLSRALFLLLLVPASPAFAQEHASHASEVDPVMILPFVLLLLSIAVAPFINKNWWEKNYPLVAVGLGSISSSCTTRFG
jgi:hypothetical protein